MSLVTKSLMKEYERLGRKLRKEQPEGEDRLKLLKQRTRIGEQVLNRIESGVNLTPECVTQIEKNLTGG